MTTTETLSPAQKAWVTRRAKIAAGTAPAGEAPAKPKRMSVFEKQARESVVARSDRSAIEPATEWQLIDINLREDPVVGIGMRRFTVLGQNARKVKLFYAPLLVTTEVPLWYFKEHWRPAKQQDRDAYRDIVRRNIYRADTVNQSLFDQHKPESSYLSDGGADAQRVLELLDMPTAKKKRAHQ